MKKILVVLCSISIVFAIAGVAGAALIQYSDRATFEAQGTIIYNYGFDDFGSGYSSPGDPWTSHGVTYTTGDNLIVGTGTLIAPISNIFVYNFHSPLTANIETSPQYDMFGLDLSYLEDFSLITFEVYTNQNNYTFSGISAPNCSISMDFYGFIAGSGEYFTGLKLSALSDFTAPAIDNVTLGTSASVPEPATMLLLGSGLVGLVGFRRKK